VHDLERQEALGVDLGGGAWARDLGGECGLACACRLGLGLCRLAGGAPVGAAGLGARARCAGGAQAAARSAPRFGIVNLSRAAGGTNVFRCWTSSAWHVKMSSAASGRCPVAQAPSAW
jgi:hypothetical protein